MINKPRLSVVLPAYLEEENLRLLLPRLNASLSGLGQPFEIIVIDTVAPMDSTAEVCRQNGARWVARRGGNLFGDAVRTGIQEAAGDFTLFMDADGSHPPELIPKLWAEAEGCDIVAASRYVQGGFTENSPLLTLMSRALNFTYALVLNIRCKDVSNSFKLYRTPLLKDLTLRCGNFDIIEEILVRIGRKKKDLRIKEVPFTFKKRMFGETKRNLLKFVVSYIFTLLKLRFMR